MFNNFTSSDEHERDRTAFKRLCALRAAREAGYFDEPVGERSDDEFDEWLAQQPGLGKIIDHLKAAGQWDYESDEGFRGRKV